MTTYHNTTDLKGKDLVAAIEKAESQDRWIYHLFGIYNELSPSQAYLKYPTPTPITSIRRSITNLTKNGNLVKTDQKVMGMYGRPEYVWKLAGNQLKLF